MLAVAILLVGTVSRLCCTNRNRLRSRNRCAFYKGFLDCVAYFRDRSQIAQHNIETVSKTRRFLECAWQLQQFASGIFWCIQRNMLMILYISKTFSRLVWSTFSDVCSRSKIGLNGCYKILFRIYFISLTQLRNLTRKVSLGAAARRPHHYATANTLLTITLLTVGIQTRISWYKNWDTWRNNAQYLSVYTAPRTLRK